jgi:hypothetical protein
VTAALEWIADSYSDKAFSIQNTAFYSTLHSKARAEIYQLYRFVWHACFTDHAFAGT